MTRRRSQSIINEAETMQQLYEKYPCLVLHQQLTEIVILTQEKRILLDY